MNAEHNLVFCGTEGLFCSVGCQVRGEHRDWALTNPWIPREPEIEDRVCECDGGLLAKFWTGDGWMCGECYDEREAESLADREIARPE